jgi:hypothetical protein
MIFKLPNGNVIDKDMIEEALENASVDMLYFLNLVTGEVAVLTSELIGGDDDEMEELREEIDGSNDYVKIERLSSHETYRWMEDFVEEIVAPKNARVAENLSIALMGKGAFRRFKDVLRGLGDEWTQAWYRWRDDQLNLAIKEWLADLPVEITEEASS